MAILNDSGDRREFGTGAVRDMAEGKGRMDLIPWDIALKIRTCIHNWYGCGADINIDSLFKRFSDIEFHLNNDGGQILEEKFETAAAWWIMHHYYYMVNDISFDVSVDDAGIMSYDSIDRIWAAAMLDVAKHFEDGAKKYSDNNWRKGIPVWCFFDSGSRHLMKYIIGWRDEPHDRAVLWNLMCGAWTVSVTGAATIAIHSGDAIEGVSDERYMQYHCVVDNSSENR